MGDLRSSNSAALREEIRGDTASGYTPAGVICVTGATSMRACDYISAMISVVKEFDLYVHINATLAGSAMICEEFRAFGKGLRMQIALF